MLNTLLNFWKNARRNRGGDFKAHLSANCVNARFLGRRASQPYKSLATVVLTAPLLANIRTDELGFIFIQSESLFTAILRCGGEQRICIDLNTVRAVQRLLTPIVVAHVKDFEHMYNIHDHLMVDHYLKMMNITADHHLMKSFRFIQSLDYFDLVQRNRLFMKMDQIHSMVDSKNLSDSMLRHQGDLITTFLVGHEIGHWICKPSNVSCDFGDAIAKLKQRAEDTLAGARNNYSLGSYTLFDTLFASGEEIQDRLKTSTEENRLADNLLNIERSSTMQEEVFADLVGLYSALNYLDARRISFAHFFALCSMTAASVQLFDIMRTTEGNDIGDVQARLFRARCRQRALLIHCFEIVDGNSIENGRYHGRIGKSLDNDDLLRCLWTCNISLTSATNSVLGRAKSISGEAGERSAFRFRQTDVDLKKCPNFIPIRRLAGESDARATIRTIQEHTDGISPGEG